MTASVEKLEKECKEILSEVKGDNSLAVVGEEIVMAKEDERIQDKSKHTKYRLGEGMLLFLVKYLRTYISNAVRELSKANLGPNPAHNKKLLNTTKHSIDTIQKVSHYEIMDIDRDEKMENKSTRRVRFCR